MLALAHSLPGPGRSSALWWLWIPVPLAVTSGLLEARSVAGPSSQKLIFFRIARADRSLLAPAMWELIPSRRFQSSARSSFRMQHPPLCSRFYSAPGAVSQSTHCDTVATGPVLAVAHYDAGTSNLLPALTLQEPSSEGRRPCRRIWISCSAGLG